MLFVSYLLSFKNHTFLVFVHVYITSICQFMVVHNPMWHVLSMSSAYSEKLGITDIVDSVHSPTGYQCSQALMLGNQWSTLCLTSDALGYWLNANLFISHLKLSRKNVAANVPRYNSVLTLPIMLECLITWTP